MQLAFFSPSLEKIGCIYKTLYQYNADTVKQEDIVYILNTRPQKNDALGNSVIAISVLMLLSSASEIIQFVPNNFKDVDPDLVAEKERKENPEAAKKKKRFFYLDVKFLVIKVYPPGSITFMSTFNLS
jgi:hypothetical protein